jgi:hypothetical protein
MKLFLYADNCAIEKTSVAVARATTSAKSELLAKKTLPP